jgi:hypothetical protein
MFYTIFCPIQFLLRDYQPHEQGLDHVRKNRPDPLQYTSSTPSQWETRLSQEEEKLPLHVTLSLTNARASVDCRTDAGAWSGTFSIAYDYAPPMMC